jgi:hypothetical protein
MNTTVRPENVKRSYHKNGKLKMLKEFDNEHRVHGMVHGMVYA